MIGIVKFVGIGFVECLGIVEDVLGIIAVIGVLIVRLDEDVVMRDREVDLFSEWDFFVLVNSVCFRVNCIK